MSSEATELTKSAANYEIGSLVWVLAEEPIRKRPKWFQSNQHEKEAGTVLGVGCSYMRTVTKKREKDTASNSSSSSSSSSSDEQVEKEQVQCKDGIMVKLQVSCTKGIYPPSRVRPLEDNSDSVSTPPSNGTKTTTRRSRQSLRRARVTPSPAATEEEDTDNNKRSNTRTDGMDVQHTNDKGGEMEDINHDDDDDNDEDREETFQIKRSTRKRHLDETKNSQNGSNRSTKMVEGNKTNLKGRVECPTNSRAKCQTCNVPLAKGELRIQKHATGKSTKGPWFHVRCFPNDDGKQLNAADFANSLEGYQSLPPDQQIIFQKEWLSSSASALASAEKNGNQDTGTKAKDEEKDVQQKKNEGGEMKEDDHDHDDEVRDEPFQIKRSTRKRRLDETNPSKTTTKNSQNALNHSIKIVDAFKTSEKATSPNNKKGRVECATNARAKCQTCNVPLAKGELRIQKHATGKSTKGPWFHVRCFPNDKGKQLNAAGFADSLEGYQSLPPDQQIIFQKEWLSSSASASPSAEKNMDTDSGEDTPLITLKTTKSKGSATAAMKKKTVSIFVASESSDEAQNMDNQDSDNDDDDDDDDNPYFDRPFKIDYAPTSRATCRACDERIAKDSLRISHRPLFRGKPGFVVYRHLNCAIFSEEVRSIKDVGGWKNIKGNDRHELENRIVQSAEERRKEMEELQPDELVQASFQGETRNEPPGLVGSLLPFQVEGISWMYHQEVHVPEIRGGILADEMGMGKTIQTIATILDHRPKLQHSKPGAKHPPSAVDIKEREAEELSWKEGLKSWSQEMEMSNVPKKLLPKLADKASQINGGGARAGTLVICPVIALFQWREEIEKFTDNKDNQILSIATYHGPNRASENPREMLRKYDIVLTTYQVLEADFRKMVSPNKVKCPNCGGKFKIDKLRIHLKYFCGEGAQRTEAQARQRRSTDRHHSRNDRRGGGDGRPEKKKISSKSASTKTKSSKAPPTTKSATKRVIRLKSTGDYESDSELSVPEDVSKDLLVSSSVRPSRAAAKTASKRMSASKKDWQNVGRKSKHLSRVQSDSEDYDSSDDEASEDSVDSSDSKEDVEIKPKKSKPTKPGQRRITPYPESDSSDSENPTSSSEEDAAIKRARKKQRLALERAKKTTKSVGKKKSFEKSDRKKTNGKVPPTTKIPTSTRKGKKHSKFSEESSSSDESSDEGDEGNADWDPLEGIDLEKLSREAMSGSCISVLHSLCWWRVVLDEAHMIKSRSSQTAAAAFSLTSLHRWCLSGTPLQNRVGELYSLIRFLRIDPMAHYFCRKEGCGCKSIHYRMLHGKCLDCGHGSIQHFSHFNKHVLNPIQRDGYQGDGRRAMMKLKTEVLDKALLRRTKQSRAEDMNLPPRQVTIRTIRLHPVEEDFYNALYTQTKSSFDDYVTEGTLLNNYAHIFDLLTKMRQAVDHPYLIVYSKKNEGKFPTSSALVANGSIDCQLCRDPPTDRIVSACCGAAFCRSCVIDYMNPALENADQAGAHCPSCRGPFTIDLNQASSDVVDDENLDIPSSTNAACDGMSKASMPSLKELPHVASGSILRRINLADFATSTKVEALVQELVQMRKERPGSKALVFSQFVNMLDLIRWRLHSDPCLQDLGLGVRIIHGGMNVQSRDSSLKDFREDSCVRVLLMSLKAGGVALNLTVANEAYLMDPWWNPAAEMQAIDRTHRLGQYRPIRAIRFIAEDTVEERVLQLQEKKRLVFDGTVGRDAASLKMLTVDDMKSLFA